MLGPNTSRIQNKEVYAALRLQAAGLTCALAVLTVLTVLTVLDNARAVHCLCMIVTTHGRCMAVATHCLCLCTVVATRPARCSVRRNIVPFCDLKRCRANSIISAMRLPLYSFFRGNGHIRGNIDSKGTYLPFCD